MIEDGRDHLVYIKYTLFNFPKTMNKIVPFALFFSFSYVLAKYEINNEMIVFWNNGVDKLTLINFFLKFDKTCGEPNCYIPSHLNNPPSL